MFLTESTADAVPGSVSELMAATLAAYDDRKNGWAAALRQDAVESIGRVTWRRHQKGIRVPVYDMFINPMRQGAEALGRRFVDQAAELLADEAGCSGPDLIMAGRGSLSMLPIDQAESDLVIARDLFEGNVPYRRRYESSLVNHADALYDDRIRPWFVDQLEQALTVMQTSKCNQLSRPT